MRTVATVQTLTCTIPNTNDNVPFTYAYNLVHLEYERTNTLESYYYKKNTAFLYHVRISCTPTNDVNRAHVTWRQCDTRQTSGVKVWSFYRTCSGVVERCRAYNASVFTGFAWEPVKIAAKASSTWLETSCSSPAATQRHNVDIILTMFTRFLVGVEPHDVEGLDELLVQLMIVEWTAHVAMRQVAVVTHVIKQEVLCQATNNGHLQCTCSSKSTVCLFCFCQFHSATPIWRWTCICMRVNVWAEILTVWLPYTVSVSTTLGCKAMEIQEQNLWRTYI